MSEICCTQGSGRPLYRTSDSSDGEPWNHIVMEIVYPGVFYWMTIMKANADKLKDVSMLGTVQKIVHSSIIVSVKFSFPVNNFHDPTFYLVSMSAGYPSPM